MQKGVVSSSLVLAIIVSIFTNSFVAKAQGKSTSVSLDGEWNEAPFVYVNPADASITTITLTYAFDGPSKVTLVSMAVTAMRLQPVVSYPSGTLHSQIVPPRFTQRTGIGTYKLRSNSIVLEFSDRTIHATIVGDNMEGVSTNKSNGKDQKWRIGRTSVQNSPSTPGVSGTDPTTQGIIDQEALLGRKLDCMPNKGTLVIKMKDGSNKSIKLSSVESVTVAP